MSKIYDRKLTDRQVAQLNNCTDTTKRLIELGREDLAEEYIQLLLETWVKMFLT